MKPLSAAFLVVGLFMASSVARLEAQFAEAAKLLASDGALGDEFGRAVSISGDRALVGAYYEDDVVGSAAGSAYVFERNVAGTWTQVAKLLASDGHMEDQFGRSVSISGDRALVGSWKDDDLGDVSGSAYVFERNVGGAWTQAAKLLASDGAVGDWFGYTVSISGDRALVGAIGDDDLGSQSGSAYVFERNAGGAWTQVAKLTANDGAANDVFGQEVSISGDRALAGSYWDDDQGSQSGSAYVFERNAAGTWTQVAKLLASDGTAGDWFGNSVSISGDQALVGAVADDDWGPSSGSAYVFKRKPGGTWTQAAKLLASDGAAGDSFSVSVSISGDRALVGALDDDDLGEYAGSAYVFEWNAGGSWAQVAKLLASDGSEGSFFGVSVSISGDRALVGAYKESRVGPSAGAGYVFESTVCSVPLSSAEVVRLGSPPNPNALLPGLTSGPVIGSTWDPTIEHITFMPGATFDFLAITANPTNLDLGPFGTLLCDPAIIFSILSVVAGVPFAVAIPSSCAFVGASICTQGASLDPLGTILLTNALDITLGTF